jgi:hypothetical protein
MADLSENGPGFGASVDKTFVGAERFELSILAEYASEAYVYTVPPRAQHTALCWIYAIYSRHGH